MKYKIAEIIPILKLPKFLGVFDYIIPEEMLSGIKIGQIVKIVFRKSNALGLVFKIKDKSEHKKQELKTIIKIIEGEPFVTKLQLQLLPWLSQYYFQSPALFLKTMLPKILKRPKKSEFVRFKTENIELNRQEELTFEKIKNNSLIIGRLSSNFYAKLARRELSKNKQSIFLFPEIKLTESFTKIFKDIFGADKLAIFHSQVSASEYYLGWKRALNNEAKIIIGTRMAVFAPVANLGLIVIDAEHDSSFKQRDLNPRYQTQTIALKIAELTGAKMVFSSPCPSVKTFFWAKDNSHQILNLIPKITQKKPEIVDMKDEHKKKNFSIFSETLQSKIKNNQGQSILFLNRKGLSSFIICRDCGYMPKCVNCQLPYSFLQSGELYCHQCKQKEILAPICPQCSGNRFRPVGFGTQKVEQESRQHFPNLTTGRIDSDVSEVDAKKIITDFKNNKIKILIATQAIFSQKDLPKVNLVAMLSADISLQIPDYTATEKTWQLILQAINLSKKDAIIQTWNPENLVIQSAVTGKWQVFYGRELSYRKEFNYPPHGMIIKLIFQNINFKISLAQAEKTIKKIKAYVEKERIPLIAWGPMAAPKVKIRGRYRHYVILKFKSRFSWLNTIINLAPDDCIIDVEPEELI